MREFSKAVIICIDGADEEPQGLSSISSPPFLSSFFELDTDCTEVSFDIRSRLHPRL